MTIRNWYEADKIKGTNISGTLRIYRESVVALVKNNHGKKSYDKTPEEIQKKIKPTHKPSAGFVRRW